MQKISLQRTGRAILVELIDLVDCNITFLSQTLLLSWLPFLVRSLSMTLSAPFFFTHFFFLSLASTYSITAFLPSRNSSFCLSFYFTFHRKAYEYWRTEFGGFRDHLKDVLNLVLLELLLNSVSGSTLELMYSSLIINI